MTTRAATTLFILLVILIGLGACGNDKDSPFEPPAATTPGYASPDLMLAGFRRAYEDVDLVEFTRLLHADYVMALLPETASEFPAVGTTLDRAEELRIAARMFGGEPLVDPYGNLVPAISSISFSALEVQEPWSAVGSAGLFPGSVEALFDVTILIGRPGYSTVKIQGQLRFFAAMNIAVIGGLDIPYWELIGLQDLSVVPGGKNAENTNWGSLKALFWIAE